MAIGKSIQKRVMRLLALFEADTSASFIDADGTNLLEWMTVRASRPDVSLRTTKMHRRWLARHFDDIKHPCAVNVRLWLPPQSKARKLIDDDLDSTDLRERSGEPFVYPGEEYEVSLGDGGSKKTLTYVDAKCLNSLLKQLISKTATKGADGNPTLRYKQGPYVKLMMNATYITGLRPSEWRGAKLHESYHDPVTKITLGPVLEVPTLKQNHRREDNPLNDKRLLVLDRWPEMNEDGSYGQMLIVRAMMQFVESLNAESDNTFTLWYKNARKVVHRAWKNFASEHKVVYEGSRLGDGEDNQGVTMYTARHVFAEECRRSCIYTRYELASMLGHCMIANQRYYGPRTADAPREFDFVLPRPWPGDADAIKAWDNKVNPIRFKGVRKYLFDDFDQNPYESSPTE